MSDIYETARDIEARLNRLCDDAAGDLVDDPSAVPSADSVGTDTESMLADPAVNQVTVRALRCESGQTTDTLTGSFRCLFESTQTVYVLHVPIFPPMKSVPQVAVMCHNEDIVTRTTHAKKFGLRIELKRTSDHSLRQSVAVEISASCQ